MVGAGTVPLLAAGVSAQPCPALRAGHTSGALLGWTSGCWAPGAASGTELGPARCLGQGAQERARPPSARVAAQGNRSPVRASRQWCLIYCCSKAENKRGARGGRGVLRPLCAGAAGQWASRRLRSSWGSTARRRAWIKVFICLEAFDLICCQMRQQYD